jgi:hypothetical protein
LFSEEYQPPSAHPLFERKIAALTVKKYRNFNLEGEALKEYLNEDCTRFEYNGVLLRPDLDNSTKEDG